MDSFFLDGKFSPSLLFLPPHLAWRRDKFQRPANKNNTNHTPIFSSSSNTTTATSIKKINDDEDFLALILLSTTLVSGLQQDSLSAANKKNNDRRIYRNRVGFYVRDRLDWPMLVSQLLEEGGGQDCKFSRTFRMSFDSFSKLCDMLRPSLQADEAMSYRRTKKAPICPEIMLYCLIRWLAGGTYHDVRLKAGISIPSFYRVLHSVVDAILDCEVLGFSFPSTPEELQDAADAFASVSTREAVSGCVACVDGYLLSIVTPSPKETGNVKSYYSGHYSKYGINIQAACDASLRFVYVGVAAPGGTNDITAYRKTRLSTIADCLPLGKYILGDAAYVCSETLLTPFSGASRHIPGHDDYNFFCSQLRIRIEQAFGLMTTKWRILKSPMQVKLKNVGNIFMSIARLHNYCINERLRRTGDILLDSVYVRNIPTVDAEGQPLFQPTTPPEDRNTEPAAVSVPGNSAIRDMLVQQLQERGLTRPN